MKKNKVTICIGTMGSPTFRKCRDLVSKYYENHQSVDRIVVIKNMQPQSAWLNEMRKACLDTEWCLQVDEDMYLEEASLDVLIRLYKANEAKGVKILNASSLLYDLFLDRSIGSLKLWSSQALQELEFMDVLGGDRDFAKRALKKGYCNVETRRVLGEHDSAPTPAIAFAKYYEYVHKIIKFGSKARAEAFTSSLKKKWDQDPNNYTKKKAYDGARSGLKAPLKNRSKRSSLRVNKKEKNKKQQAEHKDPNDYFDGIFYINLKNRKDRMLSIQKRLAINGLFASRFEAISGYSKKNKLIYNKLSLKKNKYDLELGRKALRSPGALGCLLSVRSIIRDAKKRGLKRILLLDDDVIFSKNFLNDFSKASDLPGDWKLLYLGASQHNWSGISKFNDNFYYAKNTSGTFAVGIDHSLFDYILNISSELELPIDSYLERFVQPRHSKSCFVFTENLMIADVTSSDIREPQDQVKRAKRMRWDLSLYDFKEFGLKNIVLCVTTYNRLKYLKDFINSFNETKNTFFKWTLIISDDGSTDQSIEYINSLNLPDVSIVKIFNKRVGVHMQTNLIFDKISKMNYDFAFKADDDIIFKKKGWDSSYIRSSIRSSKKHLVYYNNSWKKSRFIKREPINHIESQASCEDAMGCFWTFNKNVLKRVGNFDTDNFGHRGQGHIDFTARCCRLGFNDSKNVWDSINSNIYISMQPRDGYLSTTDGSEKDALSRSKKEKSRKLTVIRQKRGRVICKI